MAKMVKPAQDQYSQQVSNTDKAWWLQTGFLETERVTATAQKHPLTA